MTFEQQIAAALRRYESHLVERVFVDVAQHGCNVLRDAYQRLLRLHTPKPGGKNFSHGYEGIGTKVGLYKDRQGAWGITGPVTKGGQLLAPQLRFGESGTEPRYTKKGAYRGVMPVMAWLQHTANTRSAQAQVAMQARLKYLVH